MNAPQQEGAGAWNDLLTYVLQGDMHNRLTPRVIDIAYTAFMQAKRPNAEDGGPSDWFNDTKPVIEKAIDKLRNDLAEDRAKRAALASHENAGAVTDPLKLGQDVARWTGCEYTAFRTDNGRPEQWVRVSVKRLGHAIAAVAAAPTAAEPAGEAVRVLIDALERYLRQDETAADTDNGVYRQGQAAMAATLAAMPTTRLMQDEDSGRDGRRYNEWHASRPDARRTARNAADDIAPK